jgi:hypothetical protein
MVIVLRFPAYRGIRRDNRLCAPAAKFAKLGHECRQFRRDNANPALVKVPGQALSQRVRCAVSSAKLILEAVKPRSDSE